jgi:hypothetical protein
MFRGKSSRDAAISGWLGNCPHTNRRRVSIPIYEDDVNMTGPYVGMWIVEDCNACGEEVSRTRS